MCLLNDMGVIRLQGIKMPNLADCGSESRRSRPVYKMSLLQGFLQQAHLLFVPAIALRHHPRTENAEPAWSAGHIMGDTEHMLFHSFSDSTQPCRAQRV